MDKKLEKKLRKAAAILRDVVAGDLAAGDAIQQWPIPMDEKLYRNDKNLYFAIDSLQHFLDDEDIRKKDAEYAKWQLDQLEIMAKEIENKTTHLGDSNGDG